jgi:glucosylceramidase
MEKYLFWVIPFLLAAVVSCNNQTTSTKPPVNPPPGDTTGTSPTKPAKTDVNLWLTKADGSVRFQKQNVSLLFHDTTDNNLTITVDTAKTYQSVAGFGFALTGGSAYLIQNLPKGKRNTLLHELFTTDSTNVGVSYLRVSIGASDMSRKVFTYDDMPAGKTDTTLQHFDLGPDKYALVPLLQEILAINPDIKIIATPWSAPAWMKTNDSPSGGSLKKKFYGVYAQYFVKYIKTMKKNGIRINAITPQNEPLNANNNPAMVMKAPDEDDFVKNYLGPVFKSANLDTKIIIYDHNCDDPGYPLSILADPAARKYIAGSAFHLYAGSITALSKVHNAYPRKNVYFTEQYTSSKGSFSGDLEWHVKNLIIGAMRNWSKNVIEWNLASNPNYGPHTPGGCSVCKGALTIGSTITRNVSYYIIASASKFVRPGSKRIASNIAGTLQNVAFKAPDGKKVLIVLNTSDSKQQFDIKFDSQIVTTSLDGGAVGTYIWK